MIAIGDAFLLQKFPDIASVLMEAGVEHVEMGAIKRFPFWI